MEMYTKVFNQRIKAIGKTPKNTLLIRGAFTSDQRDEVGDIITRAATEAAIPKYREWANIRLMHQPKPVGRAVKIGAEDGLGWNEIEIEVIDPEAVFMVENGLLTALSVGILVDLDTVNVLNDGGWVINSYSLAEISLVDHPANYDAKLQSSAKALTGLRLLMRQHGTDAVLHGVKSLLEEEAMNENQELEEKAVAEVPAEPTAVEPEAPEAVAAEAPAVEEVPVVEEAPAVEEEPAAADEPVVDPTAVLIDAINNMGKQLADMAATIVTLAEKVDGSLKALAEAQPATERAVGEVEEVEVPADAVNMKAAVPETVLPDEEVTKAVNTETPSDLRSTLRRMLANH
jgi:hypothetical protein